MVKTTPLDMSTYEYLFNSSRIPTRPEDSAQNYDPASNNHIAVIRRGRFYEFEVVNASGEFLSAADMQKQFERIQKLADQAGDEEYPVGILTGENRDTWADARETIIKASPANQKALERIQSAIVVVALDEHKPVTREEFSRLLWCSDGKSRFYDKHECESDALRPEVEANVFYSNRL